MPEYVTPIQEAIDAALDAHVRGEGHILTLLHDIADAALGETIPVRNRFDYIKGHEIVRASFAHASWCQGCRKA